MGNKASKEPQKQQTESTPKQNSTKNQNVKFSPNPVAAPTLSQKGFIHISFIFKLIIN
jgi:hypothetical protein